MGVQNLRRGAPSLSCCPKAVRSQTRTRQKKSSPLGIPTSLEQVNLGTAWMLARRVTQTLRSLSLPDHVIMCDHMTSDHVIMCDHVTSDRVIMCDHVTSDHVIMCDHVTSDRVIMCDHVTSDRVIMCDHVTSDHVIMCDHVTSDHVIMLVFEIVDV